MSMITNNLLICLRKPLTLVGGDESDFETQRSCGNIKKDLILKDREYQCDSCGVKIDRDYNASLNILSEGLRILKKDIHGKKKST